MYKAVLFFLAVAIVTLLAFAKPTEGFQNLMGVNWTSANDGTPPACQTALPVKQPKTVNLAEAGVGNIPANPIPAAMLPSAPAPQRSKETPNPYRDPSLQPAKQIRILSVKEDLQAFFGFQAFMLEQKDDPSITIPLTRARADMAELIDVQSVMERNPGLQSRINDKQLDDIQANLRYLRAILHDLEASGDIQPQAPEGFADMGTASSTESVNTDRRASLKELQDFQVRVVVEITRLNASGTTDPVIQGRLNTLNRIKDDVDQVIDQLQRGSITPDTVPIYASDIERALPVLGKPTSPLPTLLRENNLPPAIASLFPGGMAPRDTEQAVQINNIVKGYMKNLFEGASWGLNFMFRQDNPKIAALKAQAAAEEKGINPNPQYPLSTGLPGVRGTAQLTGNDPLAPTQAKGAPDFTRTDSTFDSGLPGTSVSRTLPEVEVGKLDWKQRSQQIKEQIRRRGLDPTMMGALPDDAIVSDDFSQRGQANMLCMRLSANTDPGFAETCGCPPKNWVGWRD